MAILDSPATLDIPLDILEIRVRRRDAALQHMVRAAHARASVRDAALVSSALLRRERVIGPSPGKFAVVPHVRSLGVVREFVVVGRAAQGIEWSSADDARVNLVVLVLSPAEGSLERHMERVALLMRSVRLQRQRQRLLEAVDVARVRALLEAEGAWTTSAP